MKSLRCSGRLFELFEEQRVLLRISFIQIDQLSADDFVDTRPPPTFTFERFEFRIKNYILFHMQRLY